MATENTNLSHYDKTTLPDVSSRRFGIVVAQWNSHITEALYKGTYATLTDCGVPPQSIIRRNVPGSFELVYAAKQMLQTERFDAVIAIGSVIRGETPHFHFVCNATANGIQQLNADPRYRAPVIFCVLTDDTLEQAQDRSGGKHGNKGVEAAIAAIKMTVL